MRTLALAVVSMLAACGGGAQRADTGSTGKAPQRDVAAPTPPTGPNGTTTEFKPHAAFRAYAADILAVKRDDIEGGPIDETTARAQAQSVGNAWAYTMWLKSNPPRDLRGWVTADGTIITADQNLGLLATEVGLWTQPATDDLANKFAKLLTWSFGASYMIVIEPEKKMPPPTMTMANGAGTVVFFVSSRESGPGGAGGGPLYYSEIKIALKADHQATLTKTALKGP